jgi:AraC-like DNA-binding protein
MSEPTVAAGYAQSLLNLAVARGADRDALLRACAIAPEAFASRDARLPFARFASLMRTAKQMCKAPDLALQFGAAIPFDDISIVGLIAYALATMGEAFEQVNRYARLVVEVEGHESVSRFAIVRRADGVWLEDRRRDPNAVPELTESTWARFVNDRRRAFPDRAPYVLEVHVTHSAPAHVAAYAQYFDMPVVFDAGWNALRIVESWLDEPTGSDNRYVFGVFSAHANRLLQSRIDSATVRGRIEAVLMPVLHTGKVSMTDTARRLGLSRSALHRRLHAEGTTFEIVLDDLRRQMALDYLGSRKVSVNETAYLVGFSDASAFSRAFCRWTGTRPGKFRNGDT